jgi:hypothetical protein
MDLQVTIPTMDAAVATRNLSGFEQKRQENRSRPDTTPP